MAVELGSTMSAEGQEGIFGSESSATPSQNRAQPQHQEAETKMDDSIDNQQQARFDMQLNLPVVSRGEKIRLGQRKC
ncbi:hypothetical protein JZ751_002460 [Albula glossodonta]|uniref:Uncharacterized protein n=1 Tax=Albula glossodonta TaxID=121402 RepID=A0A8T2N739_9TELE|nr:hypothetical protein JZ751_002460 [Albula glossodonta]